MRTLFPAATKANAGNAGTSGVTERLVAALTDAISTGRMAPGQRLVEADLQAEFAAGRSSVREAIQQLHAQGLVTLAANRGASVRRLSRREVTDLFVVRERLEGLGAFLAAQQVATGGASRPAVSHLKALLVRMGKVADSPDALAYGQLNRELHRALLDLSENGELVRLVHQLSLPIFQQQFRGFLQPENQRTSHVQHQTIVAAVLEGDARAAETAMRRHVRDGLRMVLHWPDDNFAPEA